MGGEGRKGDEDVDMIGKGSGSKGLIRMNRLIRQMHRLMDNPVHLYLPQGLPLPSPTSERDSKDSLIWMDLGERIQRSMWIYPELRMVHPQEEGFLVEEADTLTQIKAQRVELNVVMKGAEKIAVDDVMTRAYPARRIQESHGPGGEGEGEEDERMTESTVVEGLRQQQGALKALSRDIHLLTSFVQDIQSRQKEGKVSEMTEQEEAILWDIASIAHLEPSSIKVRERDTERRREQRGKM